MLDFGLAKSLGPADAGRYAPDPSHSPTVTMGRTHEGVLLGTAAYMSPEQASGQAVDTRADIWAFGCVLFEMLTGRTAFGGETVSETMAAVLKSEPEWPQLPASVPAGIRRLLRRCLNKDQKQRLQHIGDARIEIDEALRAPQTDASLAHDTTRHRERVVLLSAIGLLALITAGLAFWASRLAAPASEVRVEITTPPTTLPQAFEISPDGRMLVFVATSDGVPKLWLRPLDSVTARPLTGTESASFPFWAPDGRAVAFFAEDKLKRIDLDSGAVRVLTDAHAPFAGADWNSDGTILFLPELGGPLVRVSSTDGTPVGPPLPYRGSQVSYLPDGDHFLYVPLDADPRQIYVGRVDGSEPQPLVAADKAVMHAASGQLLFVRQGTLFAQPFDAERLVLSGNPYALTERLDTSALGLSFSAAGTIAYRAASPDAAFRLGWFDRSGRQLGGVGDTAESALLSPSMSPDGRRVAGHVQRGSDFDIWLLDLARGVQSRFTATAARSEVNPIWSYDGRRVAYMTRSLPAAGDLHERAVDGSSSEEPLLLTAQNKTPTDWSPDGRFVLYQDTDPATKTEWGEIWALPLFGDRRPFPVVQSAARELNGQFSPDSRWIAYQSNESGRFEIYVQPFPGPGPRTRVSTNGGAQTRWRRDGRELFYISLDERLMAVPMRLPSAGGTIEVGTPVALFTSHLLGGPVNGPLPAQYVVNPDGQRFLMLTLEAGVTPPISLIMNWKPAR